MSNHYKETIYLDNAATTKMSEKTLQSIMPYLTDYFGNASSIHALGRKSYEVIDLTRDKISRVLNCDKNEIFFTSGATESNNWVMNFCADIFRTYDKPHIITSTIEHPSILKVIERLVEYDLINVSYVNVDKNGLINPEDVDILINDNTCLVSIQYANNEIGTIQPIKEIGEICKKHCVLFHVDATQAFGHINIDVRELNIDLLSASGHKFGAMKGVGFLYSNSNNMIEPYMCGGHQERGLRAGTENIVGIASMYYALNNKDNTIDEYGKILDLRNYFINNIGDGKINGSTENRLSNNINITFDGIEAEELMMMLSEQGIYVSTGSACTSSDNSPSYVLKSIGLSDEQANSTIRISLNEEITKEDLDYVINCIKEDINILRGC